MERFFPIGTPGEPWTDVERHQWFATQARQRSYRDEVLSTIDALEAPFEVQQYGALSIDRSEGVV